MTVAKTAAGNVLLGEADAFLAEIYRKKLEMEDFKVRIAADGEKVLQEIKKKIPDVIITDIQLPKIDGFELLKKLKSARETMNIPVICLTSLGEKKDVERALALGADGYLIKAHFSPAEVVDKVKKLL